MANFQNHLLYGLGTSAVSTLVGYLQFGLTRIQAFAAFFLATLASLAPDLDHSESVPGKIFFDVLGVLFPISLIHFIPSNYLKNFRTEHWIIYFCLGYIFIKYILFRIFGNITEHRGIFHSIPAAIICGQVIFFLFPHLVIRQRITIGVIGMVGYLTHLFADECYSVDWNNNEFKRSFGTAIDLGRVHKVSTWIGYTIICILGYFMYGIIHKA